MWNSYSNLPAVRARASDSSAGRAEACGSWTTPSKIGATRSELGLPAEGEAIGLQSEAR